MKSTSTYDITTIMTQLLEVLTTLSEVPYEESALFGWLHPPAPAPRCPQWPMEGRGAKMFDETSTEALELGLGHVPSMRMVQLAQNEVYMMLQFEQHYSDDNELIFVLFLLYADRVGGNDRITPRFFRAFSPVHEVY